MLEGGISDSRNPHLALMLGLIGLVERAGSGVSDVISACHDLGISGPSYVETTEPETVTAVIKNLPFHDTKDALSEIIRMMESNPRISLSSISEHMKLDKSRVARLVNKMKAEGIVERVGGTRGTWSVHRP